MRKEIEATALFVDIRNFTGQLKECNQSDKFIDLIEKTYSCGLITAINIVGNKNLYINSTGDGFLLILFGKDHYLSGFLTALVLQKKLTVLFENTRVPKTSSDYYFGIGLESGYVKEVQAKYQKHVIKTYLGNVINISSRLESLTKDYFRAPILYGPEINELLVKNLLKKNSYKEMMEKAKSAKNTEEAEKLHTEMTKINSRLLSSYLFEHKLKGVDEPIPTFRISPTLFNTQKEEFKNFIDLLPSKLKLVILKELEFDSVKKFV